MKEGNSLNMIPVVDPRAQYHELREEIDGAVLEVLGSGRYILGEAVTRFEAEMRSFLSLEAAFGCANGTDALILTLMAYELNEGDEVLVPAFSFVAPLEAIVLCGAIPRLVDVDPETFNIDPDMIEESLSPRTRAIVAVHLFGQCADMDPIIETARLNDLKVIEDAAQSFGAASSGKLAGSMGDACCFSFYPTKNLGCMGDGGLVGAMDQDIVPRLQYLRNHGEERKYHHTMVGMNSRLDELQAAIMLAKFPLVEKWNLRRAEIASMYDQAFSDLDLRVPVVGAGNTHVYHQYTVKLAGRDDLKAHLEKKRISTAVHYPLPLSIQPAYAQFNDAGRGFPVAERLAEEVLSLPVYPHMDDGMLNRVIDGVRSFFGR